MSEAGPTIDFTQIPFPTDRLTVRDLRRACPHGFDLSVGPNTLGEVRNGPYYRRQSLDVVLGDLIDVEREVAERAFFTALGAPIPDRLRGNPDEAVECLTDGYVRLGLSSGEQHVRQLVREMEAKAADQARQHLGRPR